MCIKIAIVEDCDEIRMNFVQLFNDNEKVECVGAYANAEDFISEFRFLSIDVVFMDIELPKMDGIECIKLLKNFNKKVHFIVYTVFENNDKIFNAIRAGASGYLLKSTPPEKLISATHEIMRGESPMSGSIALKVIQSFQNPVKEEVPDKLSERENEILNYLSKGYRYKDIAEELFLSTETVRTHIRNIYEKLQVNSRTMAINKAGIFAQIPYEKYLNSSVDETEEEQCCNKILELFNQSKPFLQEKYSLQSLAKSINYPVYVVSQSINNRLGKNFFEFINHYRIKEALQLLKSQTEKITIEAIAYDCGFGSRTSFYNALKKETGKTPKEIIEATSKDANNL